MFHRAGLLSFRALRMRGHHTRDSHLKSTKKPVSSGGRGSAPTAKEPQPESKPSVDEANSEPVAVAVAVAVAEEPQTTSATEQPEVGSKPDVLPKVVQAPVAEEPESGRAPAAEQPKAVPTDEQSVAANTAGESKPEVVAVVKAEPEVGSE